MIWNKIRKIKNIEPFLGLLGLAYIFVLLLAATVLVNFLVRGALSMLVSAGYKQQPPPVFNLDAASAILEGRGIETGSLLPAPLPLFTATTSVSSTASQLSPADVSLRILNGTYVEGLAKSWQGKFKDAGFENVSMGNAQARNYIRTLIIYKPERENVLSSILEILESGGVTEVDKQADADSPTDVIIVVHK
ncbi:MAG: LytR C-terminal domain-containing protein [Patescibacteria group bacterium]